MSGIKVYTWEEIREIYSSEKPKYLALKNPSGSYEVMFNNPKGDSDQKFSEIQKAVKKKTLPPGIYYFVTKNNFNKSAAEHSFPLGIGSYNLAEAIHPAPASSEKIVSVWTPSEAVKHLSEINRLTLELENAKKTIAELEEKIAELEDDIEDQELSETPAPVNWIDKVIEIGTPLLNKFFEQRDQELQLLSQRMKAENEKQRRRNPDDPEYLEHLQKIIQSNDPDEISSEMLYLKNNYPQFYEDLCKTYDIQPG